MNPAPFSFLDKLPNAAIWVFLFSLFICFANIWGYPIFILDEAKNAEAAREMFLDNQWFVPQFNGELRTDKPPLHYFVMLFFYEIFGTNVFAARIGSAIAGAAAFTIIFNFIKNYKGQAFAFMVLAVLCAAPLFVMEFHLAVPDPYLILFMTLAYTQFYNFSVKRSKTSLFVFYLAIGLATLSKGPVAIGMGGLVALLFILYKRQFTVRHIFRYRPLLGGAMVLGIAAPWFVKAHIETKAAFTEGFFFKHNFSRFGEAMEGHGGWFFVTWLFVILGLLPFIFFVIRIRKNYLKDIYKDEFLFFAAIVSLVWIGFFSVSGTKLPNYTMPCYPFVAILLVSVIQKVPLIALKKWNLFFVYFSMLLGLGAVVALYFGEPQLRSSAWVGLLFFGIAMGSLYLHFKRSPKQKTAYFLAMACTWIFTIQLLFYVGLPQVANESPAAIARQKIDAKRIAAVYKSYDPALLFGLQKTFVQLENEGDLRNFFYKNPKAVVYTKTKNFDQKEVPSVYRILFKQKALFENYDLVAIELK